MLSSYAGAKGIRSIAVLENDVVTVRVAVGYSTLLQFDSRPTQAIVGDQDSFKVEYVGNSIAIKPLTSGASTNLFVANQYERFNFRITAGRGFEPDYILKVKRKRDDANSSSGTLLIKEVRREGRQNGMQVKLLTVTSTKNDFAVIYSFEVTALNQKRTFQPGDFEVVQAGRSLPIENIYMERLSLEKGQRLQGLMVVLRSHIRRNQRTAIRVTSQKPIATVLVFAPEM